MLGLRKKRQEPEVSAAKKVNKQVHPLSHASVRKNVCDYGDLDLYDVDLDRRRQGSADIVAEYEYKHREEIALQMTDADAIRRLSQTDEEAAMERSMKIASARQKKIVSTR